VVQAWFLWVPPDAVLECDNSFSTTAFSGSTSGSYSEYHEKSHRYDLLSYAEPAYTGYGWEMNGCFLCNGLNLASVCFIHTEFHPDDDDADGGDPNGWCECSISNDDDFGDYDGLNTPTGLVYDELKLDNPCHALNSPVYIIRREWTSRTTCLVTNNRITLDQFVYVYDTTPIVVYMPRDITVECPTTAAVSTMNSLLNVNHVRFPQFGVPRAVDQCSAVVMSDYLDTTTPTVNIAACTVQYTRNATAYNARCLDDFTTGQQHITYHDTRGPVLSVIDSYVANCTAAAVLIVPTAFDTCFQQGATSITPSLATSVTTPGTCDGEYTIERTWTASDWCGNTATATTYVYVVDVTPPTVSPSAQAVDTWSYVRCQSDIPAPPTFTVTDQCGQLAFLDYKETVTGVGETTNEFDLIRRWTARDQCGNAVTWAHVYSVDEIAVVKLVAAQPVYHATKGTPYQISYTATLVSGCPNTLQTVAFYFGAETAFVGSSLATCSAANDMAECQLNFAAVLPGNAITFTITLTTDPSLELREIDIHAVILNDLAGVINKQSGGGGGAAELTRVFFP
jgi:hypothetical protein